MVPPIPRSRKIFIGIGVISLTASYLVEGKVVCRVLNGPRHGTCIARGDITIFDPVR